MDSMLETDTPRHALLICFLMLLSGEYIFGTSDFRHGEFLKRCFSEHTVRKKSVLTAVKECQSIRRDGLVIENKDRHAKCSFLLPCVFYLGCYQKVPPTCRVGLPASDNLVKKGTHRQFLVYLGHSLCHGIEDGFREAFSSYGDLHLLKKSNAQRAQGSKLFEKDNVLTIINGNCDNNDVGIDDDDDGSSHNGDGGNDDEEDGDND
ncbi:hypothetical protein STEG23_004101, partial [Scotinomys teguina]